MKHHIFLGGNQNELFLEEVNFKYLVHKTLIDGNTRDMILKYYMSLEAPPGIDVKDAGGVYVFQPSEYAESNSTIKSEDFLWFAL